MHWYRNDEGAPLDSGNQPLHAPEYAFLWADILADGLEQWLKDAEC